jgi:5'-deoxynucleotidase YfbR-like HD superfamily hydrolase
MKKDHQYHTKYKERGMNELKISEMRGMLYVQRLSGRPKHRSYSIVEHGFFVAKIFKKLCDSNNLEITADELEAVMEHDALEMKTGDLLYPVKNLNDKTKACWDSIENAIVEDDPRFLKFTDKHLEELLGEIKFRLFKKADLIELAMFCKEEINMGNRNKDMFKILDTVDGILSSDTLIEVEVGDF